MADSDSEESSSSSLLQKNPEQVLDDFRKQWKNELQKNQEAPELSRLKEPVMTVEDQARKLFFEGVDLEKRGQVFDAIRSYRKAIQLDADIEFKAYRNQPRHEEKENVVAVEEVVIEQKDDDDEDLTGVDMIQRFQNALLKEGRFFQRNTGEKTIITGSSSHFCELPMEIILYILRWVVSNDLDVRSLETCSRVCKGFYLCARDPELWRAACTRVWSKTAVGTLDGSPYASWRDMFYLRHRVLFSGCYISKTSYLRMGENNFQDHFYAPIHLVQYYRLIRFFPDGTLIMLTSADEPQVSVSKMRNKLIVDAAVHRGHFRLMNDQVMIVMKIKQDRGNRRGKKVTSGVIDDVVRTFYIELKITNTSKRRFCKLEWSHYSLTHMVGKNKVESEFELTPSRYPVFWFSRVKSFHSEADAAL